MKNLGLITALTAAVGIAGCTYTKREGTTKSEETNHGKIKKVVADTANTDTVVSEVKPIGQRYAVRLPAECKEVLDAGVDVKNRGRYYFVVACKGMQDNLAVYIGATYDRAWDKITFVPTGAEDTWQSGKQEDIKSIDQIIKESSDSYIKKIEDSDKKVREDYP